MAEVPRFVTLTVIRARARDDLRRVSGDEHVAAAARRRALHRDLGQFFVFHGSRSARRISSAARGGRLALVMAIGMPQDNHTFSRDCADGIASPPSYFDARG